MSPKLTGFAGAGSPRVSQSPGVTTGGPLSEKERGVIPTEAGHIALNAP